MNHASVVVHYYVIISAIQLSLEEEYLLNCSIAIGQSLLLPVILCKKQEQEQEKEKEQI